MNSIVKFILLLVIPCQAWGQLTVDAGNDTSLCLPGLLQGFKLGQNSTIENGTPPYTYAWEYNYVFLGKVYTASFFLDDTSKATPLVKKEAMPTNEWQKFYLNVTDSTGASARDSVLIRVSSFVYLLGYSVKYIQLGDSVQLFASKPIARGIPPLTFQGWYPDLFLENKNNQVTWSKPAHNIGYYEIYTDSIGCSDTVFSYDIRVEPVAITEFSAKTVAVYPNPVAKSILITGEKHPQLTYKITDISGKTVKCGVVQDKTIPVAELADGAYLLYLFSDQQQILTQKIIISNL